MADHITEALDRLEFTRQARTLCPAEMTLYEFFGTDALRHLQNAGETSQSKDHRDAVRLMQEYLARGYLARV